MIDTVAVGGEVEVMHRVPAPPDAEDCLVGGGRQRGKLCPGGVEIRLHADEVRADHAPDERHPDRQQQAVYQRHAESPFRRLHIRSAIRQYNS